MECRSEVTKVWLEKVLVGLYRVVMGFFWGGWGYVFNFNENIFIASEETKACEVHHIVYIQGLPFILEFLLISPP